MKDLLFATWILNCLRIFLGVLFFTAGMGKLVPGFPGLMGPPWLERELAPYGLALYAQFIAYSQILVGWLLLTRRFALLGAIMLVPMLLNIFVIVISLNWRGTPYVVAVFLIINTWLLLADLPKLKLLFGYQPTIDGNERKWPLKAELAILAGLLLEFAAAAVGKNFFNQSVTLTLLGLALGLAFPPFLKLKSQPDLAPENTPSES